MMGCLRLAVCDSPRSKDLLLVSVITHKGKLPLQLKLGAVALVQRTVDQAQHWPSHRGAAFTQAQGALGRPPAAHTRFTWSAAGTELSRHAGQAAGLTWSSESRISRSLFLVDLQGTGLRLQQGSLHSLGACQHIRTSLLTVRGGSRSQQHLAPMPSSSSGVTVQKRGNCALTETCAAAAQHLAAPLCRCPLPIQAHRQTPCCPQWRHDASQGSPPQALHSSSRA